MVLKLEAVGLVDISIKVVSSQHQRPFRPRNEIPISNAILFMHYSWL
jgi:hypothetical protein